MNPYNPANNPQAGGTAYVAHLNDDTVSRQRRRVRGEEEEELFLAERDYEDEKVSDQCRRYAPGQRRSVFDDRRTGLMTI